MADVDYKKLADATEKMWEPLFNRIKDDDALVNLERYILYDTGGKEVPHALSVTLNDISVFATNVEAALGAASEQIMVESEDKKLDTAKIEAFIRAAFKGANQLLSNRQEFLLNYFVDQQNCRQGGCAAKVIFDIDSEGVLTPQIKPLIRRNLTYGTDRRGLVWTSYKTERSRDSILTDYLDVERYLDNKTEDIKVQDIWTRERNLVRIENNVALNEKNNFGYVPIVIRIVPMGSTYGDIKYRGESLFFLIRDLVPELNRLVSIIQSLNQKALDHALQLKVPNEELPLAAVPEHDQVTNPRAVTAVPIGGGFEEMPLGKLLQQAWLLNEKIESRIQRGGLNSFDLGTFTQPMSAVALIEVAEGKENIFKPRLGTRGLLNQGITEMFIDQILTSGATQVKLGRQTYNVSDLEGEYDITFKYTNKSPGRDMARWAMYQTAGDGVSKKTKRTTILELEDPEGEERQLKSEEAELIFPSVKQYRVIKALVEEGERGDEDAELEAEMAAAEMGLTLKQILSGEVQPTEPQEETKKPQELPLVPLLGASGRVGQSPVQQEKIGGNGGSENA